MLTAAVYCTKSIRSRYTYMKLLISLFALASFSVGAQVFDDVEDGMPVRGNSFDIGYAIAHAEWQTTQFVTYYNGYIKMDYPNGDIPKHLGSCSDVLVRALRFAGADLQVLIHEDVKANLSYYYPHSKNPRADPNIDHRRVHILRKFLDKNYPESKLSPASGYLPGDIIIWGNWHCGILINEKVPGTREFYGVHNIGRGPIKVNFDCIANQLDHYRLRLN